MCNCINEINKKLEEMSADNNTKLDIPFTWSTTKNISRVDRVRIMTCKRDDKIKKKPISIQPAYCPFCGSSYNVD